MIHESLSYFVSYARSGFMVELDTNVDPSSTLQVANALIKADKDFELLVVPGGGHGAGGEYGQRRLMDFFLRSLTGEATLDWNAPPK